MTFRQYTCPYAEATCHNPGCHMSLCYGTTPASPTEDITDNDE